MTLSEYLAALRKGWIIILVTFLLVMAGAVAFVLRGADVYTATTTLYVGSVAEPSEEGEPAESADVAAARALSFATVLGGSVALEQVQEEVGESGDETVSVTALPLTVVIEVRVSSSDPQRAADVAQAYSVVAPEVLEGLETSRSGGSPVRVTTTSEPEVPTEPDAKGGLSTLVAAGVLGLGLGASIVLIRETVRRERATASGSSRGGAAGDL